MRISGPVSAIICSIIITAGALFGVGALTPNKNYATVHFENGYQKIGIIMREEIYTNAKISRNGSVLFEGEFDEVANYIYQTSAEEAEEKGGFQNLTWKSGVTIDAKAGIFWTGSEENFHLVTDKFKEISRESKLLKPKDVLARFEEMKKNAELNREKNVQHSIKFSEAPSDSFAIKKIIKSMVND